MLVSATAWADALDDKLKEVGAARAKLKTLSGPFTQERTIGLLASKITSTGTLVLVRPDRLLWDLAPPDSVSYWIGPEGLAYKGKQGQGRLPISSKLAPGLDDLRTLLGGDLAALRTRYDMKDVTPTGRGFAFEAVPKKKEDARFQKIVLELAEDLMRPKHVTLVEDTRNKTEIAFGDLAVNPTIAPARMRPPS